MPLGFQKVQSICKRPEMYVGCVSYDAVSAYINGFDVARSHGPLMGFHQWLVVRANCGNNLAWPTLVRQLLPAGTELSDDQAIRELGELLSHFFAVRKSVGLTSLFHEYAKWLVSQSWYSGPIER